MPPLAPTIDHGTAEYATHVNIMMDPHEGGHVDLSPETVADMIGCATDELGTCAAALSLDHATIEGANTPVDTNVMFQTTAGDQIVKHTANNISHDGSVDGVHAAIRAGNVRGGLGIKVNLKQPHGEESRADAVNRVIQRQKNWKDHVGMKSEDLKDASIEKTVHGTDADGTDMTRVLVKENGPIGKLVSLNPNSDHPTMKVYSEKKLTKVGSSIVMSPDHVNELANTLAETLEHAHPISKDGMRIKVVPMPHAVGVMDKPRMVQLDMKLHRTPIKQLTASEAPEDATLHTTTDDLVVGDAVSGGDGKTGAAVREEEHKKIWGADLGKDKNPKSKADQIKETHVETSPAAAEAVNFDVGAGAINEFDSDDGA